MKKALVLLLALVTVFAFCVPAFAEEAEKAVEPVQGSWKLDAVFDATDAENPVILDKDTNQSKYGSDLTILTFFEDGYADETTFEATGDMTDVAATWSKTADNEYEFVEEEGLTLSFIYDPEQDILIRSFDNFDFLYTRAVIGSWQLKEVTEIHEGDAPTDLPKEENQSLYGNAENVLTFYSLDKTTMETVVDGPESVDVEGTWEMTAPDVYVYTSNGNTTEFNYFRIDDVLYYDIIEEVEGGRQLRFTYARVEEDFTELEEVAEVPAAEVEASVEEEELIADGQIFSGIDQTLYDPETGEPVVLKELNQGGWANEETGVIYEQGEGGEGVFYGNDGSTLLTEWEYFNGGEEELIAGE